MVCARELRQAWQGRGGLSRQVMQREDGAFTDVEVSKAMVQAFNDDDGTYKVGDEDGVSKRRLWAQASDPATS